MNRSSTLFAAAAIAGGAMAFHAVPVRAADDEVEVKVTRTDAPADAQDAASERAALPAGIKARDAEDPNDIHKTFVGLAEAALTKGGFDDVVERLVDQDRNRIGNYAEKDFEDLDGVADAINKAWKDKYGDDFKLEPNEALKSVALVRGEIEDPEAVAANWPVKAVAPRAGEQDAVAAAAAEKAGKENDQGNADPDLNANIEKGRDVAVATVPASHGLPAVNVSLIREAKGWRVDVPNNLTGEQFKNNLARHLAHVKDGADQWPADKNDAAAMVAHHVLMAAYNVDMPAEQRQQ
jgi:hypothetical protein